MSAARVRGGDGTLDQLHFGLYAPPSVDGGVVRNDDIAVFEAHPARPARPEATARGAMHRPAAYEGHEHAPRGRAAPALHDAAPTHAPIGTDPFRVSR